MIDFSQARRLAAEAEHADLPTERYLAAYRSAEQVAIAAISAAPVGTRPRQDVWSLLYRVAPEFGEWAGFFAAVAPKARAVQAGARALVTERDAADLVRDSQQYLAETARWLGRREQAGRQQPGHQQAGREQVGRQQAGRQQAGRQQAAAKAS